MKLLWITNIIFPDACDELNIKSTVFGGWMLASAQEVIKDNNISLAVASVYNGNKLLTFRKKNILYYLLPSRKSLTQYDKSLEKYWIQVSDDFKPDIVHLHGTEYAHGLAYLNACGNINFVVSIQGLVSVIAQYYRSGISFKDIIQNLTFRDLIFGGIIRGQKKFTKRGYIEKEIIKKVNHVIGRTTWDKANVLAINPSLNYHCCNESLRDVFYKHEWKYENCVKHKIFISQAGYTIKGLHQLLKAMPFVLRKYPDSKVFVGGSDITSSKSIYNYLKRTGYGQFIISLIKYYKLSDKVIFTGSLSEQEICDQFLSANVFICPSSIENSSNSLSEAQLLGVPCIASYVGGTPDMIPNDGCGYLYRFEEVNMLAYLICDIFEKGNSANNILGRNLALIRHDKLVNNIALINVYKKIFIDN